MQPRPDVFQLEQPLIQPLDLPKQLPGCCELSGITQGRASLDQGNVRRVATGLLKALRARSVLLDRLV